MLRDSRLVTNALDTALQFLLPLRRDIDSPNTRSSGPAETNLSQRGGSHIWNLDRQQFVLERQTAFDGLRQCLIRHGISRIDDLSCILPRPDNWIRREPSATVMSAARPVRQPLNPGSRAEAATLQALRNEWNSGNTQLLTPAEAVVPCLLYTSPSPRDGLLSRMPSSA